MSLSCSTLSNLNNRLRDNKDGSVQDEATQKNSGQNQESFNAGDSTKILKPTRPGFTPTPPPNSRMVAFASYKLGDISLPQSFSQKDAYQLPLDIDQVKSLEEGEITAEQKKVLSQNGFVVIEPVPGKYREFYQIYEEHRYGIQPVFITTDCVYHVYHLLFDKMLRDLEKSYFLTMLNALTTAMVKTSVEQLNTLKGSDLEEPALRNVAFFGVAARILDLDVDIPDNASSLVDAEIELIDAHNGQANSPIWSRPDLAKQETVIEDYTQYIPRGHYTKTEDLKKYFKAMMWYGRLTFRLKDNFETQRALLITQALQTAKTADGKKAVDIWRNIYEPTVFLVGKTDDLSQYEYSALSSSIYGSDPDIRNFADNSSLSQFVDAAKQLPPPQVNSMWVWIWEDKTEATQGFRFMGQRFTLDEYVFGQMIWRNVGSEDNPRNLPKSLDFFAALGSKEAQSILKDSGDYAYENYEKQMDKVSKEVGNLQLDSWTQNVYYSWLYSFQPLITPKDKRYPPFMQNQAWTRKELQTALGSWTELKHDTILYAKQVYAEMGGGGPETLPQGYVEPNPEAYARLRALAQMTLDGMKQRGLLTDLISNNLDNLISELDFLKSVSEKELNGQSLTSEEYEHIFYFGGVLEQFTLAAADVEEGDGRPILEDQKAALIADVATGPSGDGLAALEEAIGQPTEIIVVLPDDPWRMAIGAVYSYYEFSVAASDRMTDEQWQTMVEEGSNPPAPDWTKMFIVP